MFCVCKELVQIYEGLGCVDTLNTTHANFDANPNETVTCINLWQRINNNNAASLCPVDETNEGRCDIQSILICMEKMLSAEWNFKWRMKWMLNSQ